MAEDRFAYEVTCRELADSRAEPNRQTLPDLNPIPPGPYLAAVVASVDRSQLNGYDLVRLVQARERLVAHSQAGSMADTVEMSYAAPGGRDSDPERLSEAFEYAADELRPALTLSRRAAEFRLCLASDVVERLPEVWELFHRGLIDYPKVRVFSDGTLHVPDETARAVVSQLAEVAPRLTVGQLRARIRRLCVEADPEDAEKREKTAHEDRRLVIEPTESGTADLHLFGPRMGDARAIGRRVNGHMISLKKQDRSGRSHDQLRADIARDLLLGDQAVGGGRGLVDIHVPASTLEGGSRPGHVGGMGPITAETARHIVASQPDAEHRITVTDDHGNPTHIYTLTRKATAAIRRHVETLQPLCTFPGCLTPASDCDLDHQDPWAEGGETSTTNQDPKCRHDHQLKDHGWTHHQDHHGAHIWTSPLGHSYITQGQSP
ncbi:MAG: DUF222 domain-containing protein [Acidimicrobiia bacterium]